MSSQHFSVAITGIVWKLVSMWCLKDRSTFPVVHLETRCFLRKCFFFSKFFLKKTFFLLCFTKETGFVLPKSCSQNLKKYRPFPQANPCRRTCCKKSPARNPRYFSQQPKTYCIPFIWSWLHPLWHLSFWSRVLEFPITLLVCVCVCGAVWIFLEPNSSAKSDSYRVVLNDIFFHVSHIILCAKFVLLKNVTV